MSEDTYITIPLDINTFRHTSHIIGDISMHLDRYSAKIISINNLEKSARICFFTENPPFPDSFKEYVITLSYDFRLKFSPDSLINLPALSLRNTIREVIKENYPEIFLFN
jgi:hypothetical protein